MARTTATEAIDLTGWPTDGPGHMQPPTPAPAESPAAPADPAPPAAPSAENARARRARSKEREPPAGSPVASTDRDGAAEVDLGAFRLRRRAASAQLNHRIAPELKEALDRTATLLGVPAVEVLEALLAELDPDSQAGLAAARTRVLARLMAGLPRADA